jgi:DNA-binding Xre family transcriptional regulator
MVIFTIPEKLFPTKRIPTWHALAIESGLSPRTIYKLKRIQEKEGGRFDRLDAATVNALCKTLNCQPGDFISYKKGP